jgi:hypothetical protein
MGLGFPWFPLETVGITPWLIPHSPPAHGKEVSSVPENENSAPPLVTPARVVAAICVIAPFVAVLAVPVFNKRTPEVAGFPFYFWWQLLWVVITALLMALAYTVVHREELARRTAAPAAIPAQAPAPAAEETVVEDVVVEASATEGPTPEGSAAEDEEGGE